MRGAAGKQGTLSYCCPSGAPFARTPPPPPRGGGRRAVGPPERDEIIGNFMACAPLLSLDSLTRSLSSSLPGLRPFTPTTTCSGPRPRRGGPLLALRCGATRGPPAAALLSAAPRRRSSSLASPHSHAQRVALIGDTTTNSSVSDLPSVELLRSAARSILLGIPAWARRRLGPRPRLWIVVSALSLFRAADAAADRAPLLAVLQLSAAPRPFLLRRLPGLLPSLISYPP